MATASVDRADVDKLTRIIGERDETIRRITDGGAEDRRTVQALRKQVYALQNPPTPTVTIDLSMMNEVLTYLMNRPYAETVGLLNKLREALTEAD